MSMTIENKSWLDRKEYPFKSNFFDLQIGKMYFASGRCSPFPAISGVQQAK